MQYAIYMCVCVYTVWLAVILVLCYSPEFLLKEMHLNINLFLKEQSNSLYLKMQFNVILG